MSHATEAMEALRTAIAEPLRGVASAVSQVRHAQGEVREADDLVPLYGAVADLILALEAAKKAASEAEDKARDLLRDAMSDTGCPAAYTSSRSHVVSLCNSPASAVATDPALIPPELWSSPKPKPNTVKAAQLLNKGLPAPGFVLRNSRQHITIKMRESVS